MRLNKWISTLALTTLLLPTLHPTNTLAATQPAIIDETIYDLLVDRFNNGDGTNDHGANSLDPYAFNGGDFVGINLRLQHIIEMGFTTISVGPIFETESYDGAKVIDYSKLDPHFGTADEFNTLISELHKNNLKIIADFPLGGVSENNTLAQTASAKATPAADGTINWNTADPATQQALKTVITEFMSAYKLDGLRLTKLEGIEPAFLNELIAEVKSVNPAAYVLTNEESDADFDAQPLNKEIEAMRKSFVRFDADTSILNDYTINMENKFAQFDDLTGPRFTYDMVEAKMFPPTRWKVAVTALFTLPGIPLVPYGTEIAVNGEKAPESHPLLNFKTDMELKDRISNMNTLRSKSEALRTGDFKMLTNKDGFTIYTRTSEDETWIVALNNTTETASFVLPDELLEDDKLLRGVLSGELIKRTEDDKFHIVLDREVAEMYIVEEDKGFNTPYLIASIMVYVLFLGFLFLVLKKGRQARRERQKEANK